MARTNDLTAAQVEAADVRASVLKLTDAQRWDRWLQLRAVIDRQGGITLDSQTLELSLLAQMLDGRRILIEGQVEVVRVFFTYERVQLNDKAPEVKQPVSQPVKSTAKERERWQGREQSRLLVGS